MQTNNKQNTVVNSTCLAPDRYAVKFIEVNWLLRDSLDGSVRLFDNQEEAEVVANAWRDIGHLCRVVTVPVEHS